MEGHIWSIRLRHTEYGRSFPEVSAKNLFLHQIDGYDDYQFATDLLKIS